MKSSLIFVAISAAVLVMSGCGRSSSENQNLADVKVEMKDVVPAPAARRQEPAPERQFIRTSEMKFRVKDVKDATSKIENIVKQNQGFVTYTNLKSNINNQETVHKSMDSSLESIRYTVDNDMVIRVPNVKLDSTLTAIATLVDYMDYRIIKADDVALQIKANQKAQTRALQHGQRIQNAIANKKGKLSETTQAEVATSDQQENADNAEINNLSLMDQVAYSTVSISMYQRVETKYWVIANDENNIIKTGMGIRIWDSIKTGWYIAEDVFIGVLNLWFVLVLAIAGYLIYRSYSTSRKKHAVLSKQ